MCIQHVQDIVHFNSFHAHTAFQITLMDSSGLYNRMSLLIFHIFLIVNKFQEKTNEMFLYVKELHCCLLSVDPPYIIQEAHWHAISLAGNSPIQMQTFF